MHDLPVTPAVARAYAALTAAGEPPGPVTLARARAEATDAALGPPRRPTAAEIGTLYRAGLLTEAEARRLARELTGLPVQPEPVLTPTFRRAPGYVHPALLPGGSLREQARRVAQAAAAALQPARTGRRPRRGARG